jgi:hypothetical protein
MTKKKVLKPAVEAWRAELARIVRFLNKGNEGSKKLWFVLTALRGPDVLGLWREKDATTSVIRYASGIYEHTNLPASVHRDGADGAAIREAMKHGHFRRHAESAFIALGLMWDERNEARK